MSDFDNPQKEIDALHEELAKIRGLFTFVSKDRDSELDGYWVDAMSDPFSVAEYVEQCLIRVRGEK